MEFLYEYAPAIQAISSVVLIIVTIGYIVFTKKLAHSAHDCFIRPVSLKTSTDDMHGWKLFIHNYGPGTALNVAVEVIAIESTNPDENCPGWYWLNEKIVKGTGPYEIEPQKTQEFLIPPIINFENNPFYLTWNTLTSKTNKSAWMIIPVRADANIEPVSGYKRLIFKTKWACTQIIIAPFTSIKRKIDKIFFSKTE